jgi:hypothetical protein
MSDVRYRRFARARRYTAGPWLWIDLGVETAAPGDRICRDPAILREATEQHQLAALDFVLYLPLDPQSAANRNDVTEHDPG